MAEAELWEQIQVILVDGYSQDLEGDELVAYCNEQFDSQGLAAIISRSENSENWSYVLTYGIYSRNIAYLNLDLTVYQTVAAVESTSEYWSYDYNDDGSITLTAYLGSDTEIVIPNIVDGYLVTILGEQLFMWDSTITSVTFSEGLTTIESKAFSNCSGITTISNWPSTLVTIGDEAFYGCSNLSSTITFGSSIKTVGTMAFYNCSNMDGTVENLIRISVSYGLNAFYGCSSLSGDVSTAMSVFLEDDDTEIPDYLFSGWSGLTGTVTIGSNIERIGQYAFYNCSGITGIDISSASSLVTIGDYAFYNCTSMGTDTDYSELDFETYCANLATIGEYSFSGSNGGAEVIYLTVPNSTVTIGNSAFRCCTALKTITLDNGGEYGTYLFSGCTALNSVTFGSNFQLTTLPGSIFNSCTSLTSMTIPSLITTIDSSCFYNCKGLTTVNYSSNLTSIEDKAFYGCTALTTLPLNGDSELISTLTTIGASAFYNCGVLGKVGDDGTTDIIDLLENSYVTTVGDNAFYGCAYLSGTIADSTIYNVTGTVKISQGASVFTGTQVESGRTFTLASSTEIADNEFQGTTVFVSSGSGGEEITEIEIPDTVTSIGDYAFSGCISITKVIIPYTVTSIGSNAFNGCTALVEVVGQNESGEETEEISGVETLGSYCFAYCTSLEEAGTFSNVTTIPGYGWYHCESLGEFVFCDGLVTLGTYSFGYAALTGVVLPSTLNTVGSYAFVWCTSLLSVDFSCCDGLTTGPSMFERCTSLNNVTLGGGVSVINTYTFASTYGLKSITLDDSVVEIKERAFAGSFLVNVYCDGNLSLDCIDNYVFNNCSSLKTIDGFDNIQEIGKYAFNRLWESFYGFVFRKFLVEFDGHWRLRIL